MISLEVVDPNAFLNFILIMPLCLAGGILIANLILKDRN